MPKILQARLQQYMNRELPDVQAGFGQGRGTRDQIANIRWIIKKARKLQKNIYFCFIDYAKAFDCVDHNKLWKNVSLELLIFVFNFLLCFMYNFKSNPFLGSFAIYLNTFLPFPLFSF